MAFKNEYVPALDEEISGFLKKARETLRLGYRKNDAWTVDRENDRVLKRTGKGHEIDDYKEEYWTFLDGRDRYSFTTEELNSARVSDGPPIKIAMTRDILYFHGGNLDKGIPNEQTLQYIKEAFQVHGGYCMASCEKEYQHTLLCNGVAL